MPDISKIKIIDTVYDIKDEETRKMIKQFFGTLESNTAEDEEEQ